jgi:hypothetical protein
MNDKIVAALSDFAIECIQAYQSFGGIGMEAKMADALDRVVAVIEADRIKTLDGDIENIRARFPDWHPTPAMIGFARAVIRQGRNANG